MSPLCYDFKLWTQAECILQSNVKKKFQKQLKPILYNFVNYLEDLFFVVLMESKLSCESPRYHFPFS